MKRTPGWVHFLPKCQRTYGWTEPLRNVAEGVFTNKGRSDDVRNLLWYGYQHCGYVKTPDDEYKDMHMHQEAMTPNYTGVDITKDSLMRSKTFGTRSKMDLISDLLLPIVCVLDISSSKKQRETGLRVGVRDERQQALCIAATRLVGMIASHPGVALRFTAGYSMVIAPRLQADYR